MRVLLADDHEIVRRGVRSLLSTQADCEICGEAVDGQDAVAKAQTFRPDVIVMDISMPKLNGLEATRAIRQILPATEILVLSQHNSPEMMRQALKAGARGYVVKSSISTDLITAIEKVGHGEPFFDQAVFATTARPLDAHEILKHSAAIEEALRESEERFRLTFEQAAVGMAHVAPDGRWVRVNQKFCEIVGYTQDELRRLTFAEITHPADLPGDLALAAKLASGEIDNFSVEKRYIGKDGRSVWVNLTVAAVRDEARKLKYFVSVIEDIGPRKASEEKLLRAQAELEATAAYRDAEARALAKLNEWNSRLLRITNLQEGLFRMLGAVIEIMGADKGVVQLLDPKRAFLTIAAHCGFEQEFLDFFREVSVNDPAASARALFSSERVVIEDIEKDDLFAPLLPVARRAGYRAVVSTPLLNVDGKPLGVVSTHFCEPQVPNPDALRRLDLYVRQAAAFVQRCNAEAALRESESRLRAIIETTPECVMLVAADGTLLHINQSGLNMIGAGRLESVVGKSVYEIVAPEHRGRFREFTGRVCRGEKGSIEFDVVGLRGERRHMETHAAPLPNPDRTFTQLAVTRDVTARKLAEDAQSRLAAIVESSADAIISKDLEGIITSWNAGAQRIFGFRADEAIGRPITIIIPLELHEEERQNLRRLRNGGRIEHHETVRVRKDGTRIDVSLAISPIRDSHGRITGSSKIARDITERKKAGDMLKEREFSGRLLQMQDQERRQIARELHDSVGQLAAGISMNTSRVAREKRVLSPDASRCVDENAVLAEQLSNEIRTLSYLLHPPLLDEMGLVSALKWYVEGFSERSKISVTLEVSSDLQRLPQDYETTIFRIVQECLSNIHRHSGSPTALLRLTRDPQKLVLEVKDEGRGFNQAVQSRIAAGEGAGVGLRGMRERVRPLGGSLEIETGSGGTSVAVTLPLVAESSLTRPNQAARAADGD
jgi:PAS domain S-box-containing protein